MHCNGVCIKAMHTPSLAMIFSLWCKQEANAMERGKMHNTQKKGKKERKYFENHF